MIKLFRNIRHQLLTENKSALPGGRFSKYLLYAIGEIVLVVIGILIALSINSWNEGRKDIIREQKVLSQLKVEYEANLFQLEEKILMRNEIIQFAFETLSFIDNSTNITQDSLISKFGVFTTDPTFDPIENDLISSGNLRLINNENLKRLLTNWSSDILALQEIELAWQKIRTEIVLPFFIESGVARNVYNSYWDANNSITYILDKEFDTELIVGKSTKTPKSQEILNNRKLEGVLATAITFNHAANLQSQSLRKRINEILEILNSEIELE